MYILIKLSSPGPAKNLLATEAFGRITLNYPERENPD